MIDLERVNVIIYDDFVGDSYGFIFIYFGRATFLDFINDQRPELSDI